MQVDLGSMNLELSGIGGVQLPELFNIGLPMWKTTQISSPSKIPSPIPPPSQKEAQTRLKEGLSELYLGMGVWKGVSFEFHELISPLKRPTALT